MRDKASPKRRQTSSASADRCTLGPARSGAQAVADGSPQPPDRQPCTEAFEINGIHQQHVDVAMELHAETHHPTRTIHRHAAPALAQRAGPLPPRPPPVGNDAPSKYGSSPASSGPTRINAVASATSTWGAMLRRRYPRLKIPTRLPRAASRSTMCLDDRRFPVPHVGEIADADDGAR